MAFSVKNRFWNIYVFSKVVIFGFWTDLEILTFTRDIEAKKIEGICQYKLRESL